MNWTSSEHIYNRWVMITLLTGTLITCVIAYNVQNSNEERINQAAYDTSVMLKQEVASRIELYQYGLRGARGAVLTAGENTITRDIFEQYSRSRDVDNEFAGARGFGFIRRVPQSDVDTFTSMARQDGWPSFSIKMLNPNFNEHYVIQYIEPVERNRQAVGLDIASEKNRREAAASSLYKGEVRLTGPITLVQATGKPQQSFLILMPIYRGGSTPSTQQERIEKGFGWSYAPLLMEEVLAGLNYDPNKFYYELFDITDLDDQILFYNSGEIENASYEQVETSLVYGRHWQSRLHVSPAFIADLHLPDPFVFLVVGCLISLLSAVVVGGVRINMARQREVMAYQSRITALVESSADGIISKNLDGVILSWNKSAESIFGYAKEEVIGRKVLDLLVPSSLKNEDKAIFSSVKEKKESISIETRRMTKAGTEVPVSLTFSPIFNNDNGIIGVSQSVHDISERKKAEAKIRELNANLESQVKERTAELRELNLLLSEVLNASSEVSIIATDMNGVITLFNNGSERMLGYSAEEVVGKIKPAHFHLESELEQKRLEIYEKTGKNIENPSKIIAFNVLSDNYDSQEWTYVDKQGNTRPVSLVITPMKNSNHEIIGFLGIAMDISEQKKSHHELMYTRDQLLLAAEVAELGIWTWDIEDDSLEWSDQMFDIYHLPASVKKDGIKYLDWYNRVHPDDRAMAETALKEAVEGINEYNLVFRIILPDDSIRYIFARASLQKSPTGKMTKMTGINRDITQERELEDWLRKAKDEAIAASASKSSFLANMSHEIRTPMNAILGMLHLAKRTDLTIQQDDYISKAQISAKSLLSLINDILDFSKVDAGKLELEKAPFEVEELLCELSTVLSGSSLGKDVELIFDIDKDIPAYLIGDKLRLLQILINLVSNAVKFTLEGSVILEIKRLDDNADVSRLMVSVQDTGIGIAQDQIDSIFDVFSQAESSTARRFGGSGLGLVICRRFVELMGGSLHVDSVLGEGSRFYFTIDLPVADIHIEKIPHQVSRESLRILIVDTNVATQVIFARMAFSLGWMSEKAESLEHAIQLVQEAADQDNAYDIVLLDSKTVDFNGQKSIAGINAVITSSNNQPKIILLTSTMSTQLDSELESVSGYLLKPVTLSKLSEAVYQSLSDVKTPIAIELSNGREEGRLAGVSLLLVEDNAFNRQVATELLTVEGANVTVAESGLEGVAMVLNRKEEMFDVILMDMQMPDVDGLEATKQIRKDARFAKLPIIAMTANVSETDRQACFNAGMNDHIGKPLDIDQMVACILKYTVLESANDSDSVIAIREEVAATELIEPAAESDEYEDIESILSRFGGSVDLYKSVVEGFTLEANDLLEKIKEGTDEKDKVKIREHLHTLKGAALTMGLLKLSNRLSAFEEILKTSEDSAVIEACLSAINVTEWHVELEEELAIIFAKIP
ncbi:CHASE domain-containing protein [Marinomonas sp.]|uniref:CHASE domain-containing protein n=1 Tax=Marinomonas sp. TaxID=1904862 RepID=UPI003BA8C0F8